jgi:protein tyrosine phosphatase
LSIEENSSLGITIRKFRLTRTGTTSEKREIVHIQYLGWPDHGVPSSPAAVFQLMRFIDKLRLEHKATNSLKVSPPMVVHCSAGIGRTGTQLLNMSTTGDLTLAGYRSILHHPQYISKNEKALTPPFF